MVIGILGEVLFLTSSEVVATPNSFKKTSESLFTDHQIPGAAPRSEFIAPKLTTFDLAIQLRSELGVLPVALAELLELYCREGGAKRLIIAGYNFGRVTVRKVVQNWRHMGPLAAGPVGLGVQDMDLTLSLSEYV